MYYRKWKGKRRGKKKRERCKTEKKVLLWLTQWLGGAEEVTYQPRYDWCRSETTGRHYPFDFSVESLQLIVEVDGAQHYKAKRRWKSHKLVMQRDLYKMQLAIDRGYTVIRLCQPMVWEDKDDWEPRTSRHLRTHQKPRCILLDTDIGEYDQLRQLVRDCGLRGSNW
jgi:very-short-patch-repair endonuclease